MKLNNKIIFFRLLFILVLVRNENILPLSNISAFVRASSASMVVAGMTGFIAYCLTSDEIIDGRYGNAYTAIDSSCKMNCALLVAKIFGTFTFMTSGVICAYQTPYANFLRSKYTISCVEKDGLANLVLRSNQDKSLIKSKLREFCGNFSSPDKVIIKRLNEDRNSLQQAIYLLILARREQKNNSNFLRRCDELIGKARKIRNKIDEAIIIIKGVE